MIGFAGDLPAAVQKRCVLTSALCWYADQSCSLLLKNTATKLWGEKPNNYIHTRIPQQNSEINNVFLRLHCLLLFQKDKLTLYTRMFILYSQQMILEQGPDESGFHKKFLFSLLSFLSRIFSQLGGSN